MSTETFEEQVATVEQAWDDLVSRLGRARTRLQELEADREAILADGNGTVSKIPGIRREIREVAAEIEELEDQQEALSGDLSAVRNARRSRLARIRELDENELRLEAFDVESEAVELAVAVDQLRRKLDEVGAAGTGLRTIAEFLRSARSAALEADNLREAIDKGRTQVERSLTQLRAEAPGHD